MPHLLVVPRQTTIVSNSGSANNYAGIEIAAGNNGGSYLHFSDTDDADVGVLAYIHADNSMRFNVAAAERLRIDSSGRVGIGVTDPGSYYGNGNDLVVGGGASHGITIKTGTTHQGIIAFADGTSGGSQQYAGYMLYDHATNHVQFATGATERLRIDGSGNVGVGYSSPNVLLTLNTTGTNTLVGFRQSGNEEAYIGTSGYSANGVITGSSFADLNIRAQNRNINFSVNSGVGMAARFNTSGSLLVGRTTAYHGSPGEVAAFQGDKHGVVIYQSTNLNYTCLVLRNQYANNSGNNVSGNMITFIDQGGTERGKIAINGSSTSYITSSDYRLKENVIALSDGITRVKQLQPKRFNFIVDADTIVDGFLAHEAQTVVPEAITGTKDEVDENGDPVMQGIDQSKLVPLLTAALQEAIAKIETLETKVAALEAS